jgi:hypothetical protein
VARAAKTRRYYLFYQAVPAIVPAIPPQYENAALFRPWAGWTSIYMFFHPFGYGGRADSDAPS